MINPWTRVVKTLKIGGLVLRERDECRTLELDFDDLRRLGHKIMVKHKNGRVVKVIIDDLDFS